MRLHYEILAPRYFHAADALHQAAFGSGESRLASIRRALRIQADGILAATLDGNLAGTVSAIDYRAFAYIGMMAVQPELRGRGIGRELMVRILESLAKNGCPAALLDATAMGEPLYRDLGFVPGGQADTYRQQNACALAAPSVAVRPASQADLPALAAFDLPIFGGDRQRLLEVYMEDFPGRLLIAHTVERQVSGYLLAQMRSLGPWAAVDTATASSLLATALRLEFSHELVVVTPAENPHAAGLLADAGFVRQSSLPHMRLGKTLFTERRDLVYGQTSFAMG